MILTLDKLSALRALRVYRKTRRPLPESRHDLPSPSPSPRKRWTPGIIPLDRLGLREAPSAEKPLSVLVPLQEQRLRGSFVRCSVRATSLPARSFVDLGDGLFIPCPELLFFSLIDEMTPEAHALLGYELCGTYSRDAENPRLGEVTYGIEPATSTQKISSFLETMTKRKTAPLVRHSLSFVADSAWSPMEAIIALMARLPVHERGYELGEVALNVRHGTTPEMVALGCKGSRVPDIEVVGTHVGFNYDSQSHLDLEAVAEAARNGDASLAIRHVRQKYLDDLRRNRELAALGHITLVVTSEDLFMPGGFDAVMLEAAMLIDKLDGGCAFGNVRAALTFEDERRRRQTLIWSLLPWEQGVLYASEVKSWVPWRI